MGSEIEAVIRRIERITNLKWAIKECYSAHLLFIENLERLSKLRQKNKTPELAAEYYCAVAELKQLDYQIAGSYDLLFSVGYESLDTFDKLVLESLVDDYHPRYGEQMIQDDELQYNVDEPCEDTDNGGLALAAVGCEDGEQSWEESIYGKKGYIDEVIAQTSSDEQRADNIAEIELSKGNAEVLMGLTGRLKAQIEESMEKGDDPFKVLISE